MAASQRTSPEASIIAISVGATCRYLEAWQRCPMSKPTATDRLLDAFGKRGVSNQLGATLSGAAAIVADCRDLIEQHHLDEQMARNVVLKSMLGDQPLLWRHSSADARAIGEARSSLSLPRRGPSWQKPANRRRGWRARHGWSFGEASLAQPFQTN